MRRDLRVKIHNFSFTYGYAFGDGPYFIMPGISLDIGRNHIDTKIDFESADFSQIKWFELVDDLQVGTTFSMNIGFYFGEDSPIGLMIKPYYQLRWFTSDLDGVNINLNPSTFQNDPVGLESNFNNGGLQVSMIFGKMP